MFSLINHLKVFSYLCKASLSELSDFSYKTWSTLREKKSFLNHRSFLCCFSFSSRVFFVSSTLKTKEIFYSYFLNIEKQSFGLVCWLEMMNQRHPFKYLKGFLKYWELFAPWESDIFVYKLWGNVFVWKPFNHQIFLLLGNRKYVIGLCDEIQILQGQKVTDNLMHFQDELK